MASRLAVVLCQSSMTAGAAAAMEERLVAELLFQPKLDATLIGTLSSIAEGSTDHLCLEGLMGSFAMLTWQPVDEVLGHLERLKLSGAVINRTAQEATVTHLTRESLGSKRRIHLFDLNQVADAESLLGTLTNLLSETQVKTVSLGLGIVAAAAPRTTAIVEPQTGQKSEKALQRGGEKQSAEAGIPNYAAEQFGNLPQPPSNPVGKIMSPNPSATSDDDEEWRHLDQLVDDLDSMQL